MKFFLICGLFLLAVAPHKADEDDGGFLDMAANFLNEYNNNQDQGQGSSGGVLEMASMLGNLMNSGGGNGGGKTQASLGDFVAGLGSLLGAKQGGAIGGIDPKLIGNFIDFFTGKTFHDMKKPKEPEPPSPMETILDAISIMLSVQKNEPIQYEEKKDPDTGFKDRKPKRNFDGFSLDNFLMMVPTLSDSLTPFLGVSIESIQDKHRSHSGELPPFLEKIHQLWDQITSSDIGKTLFVKMGLKEFLKVLNNGKSP
jgi:hypothetical protein